MVAPLYTDITAGIRAMLDDQVAPGGAVYTDDYCKPYVEMAQQTMVTYFIANSVNRMKFRTETPLTITAGTTILDYATTAGGSSGTGVLQLLPDDLVIPDQLWEAKIGGLNEDFTSMSGPVEIPRVPQADILRYWNWYDGRLHLLGATVDKLVRMDYWAELAAVDPTKRIRIINGGNGLISLAASMAARGRGAYDQADRLATFRDDGTIGGQAGWEMQQIINAETKASQSEPNRRRPYFGRDRYSNQDFWIRGRF